MAGPIIDVDECDNHQNCIQVCPYSVFDIRGDRAVVANASACQECWICVNNCPAGAITVE